MSTQEFRLKVSYSKTKQARYIPHLDTIEVVAKAIRRLKLPYAVSQGCHVRPKITFGAPLPLGHASYCEFFILILSEKLEPQTIQEAFVNNLPEGMQVTKVEYLPDEKKSPYQGEILNYRFTFDDEEVLNTAKSYLENPDSEFEVIRKKKTKVYTIGEAVRKIEIKKENDIFLLIVEFIQGTPNTPSVSKIVTALAENLKEKRVHLTLLERLSIQGIKLS